MSISTVPAPAVATVVRRRAAAPERAPEGRPRATGPDPAARARSRAAHPAGTGGGPASVVGGRPGPAPRAPGTQALAFPTEQDVHRLMRLQHPLSISLLMATTPAQRMVRSDRERLRALVLDALRRLSDEPDAAAVSRVRGLLAEAAFRAASGPTDRGLALLVNPHGAHAYPLRITPVDRVVLDPTLATRDLVRSITEDPEFLMLVVDDRSARLFHYDRRYARPVLDHEFPMLAPSGPARPDGSVGSASGARSPARAAFLREVSARVDARRAAHGLPLVLVADDRTAAELGGIARGRRAAAAVVRLADPRPSIDDLQEQARLALAVHVTDRSAAALDAIHVRVRQRRAATGLAEAWAAMLQVEPELLVVERGFSAAVAVDGTGFRVVDDPEEPGVIDDAVDELIEAVLARGGDVVMVPDGALAHVGHLVLAVRGRPARLAG